MHTRQVLYTQSYFSGPTLFLRQSHITLARLQPLLPLLRRRWNHRQRPPCPVVERAFESENELEKKRQRTQGGADPRDLERSKVQETGRPDGTEGLGEPSGNTRFVDAPEVRVLWTPKTL